MSDEQDIGQALLKEYKLGQAVALERIAKKSLDAARDCFALDNDEKAKWYRELYKQYSLEAQEIRATIQM